MSKYASDILFFLLVGVIIGILMRQRENGNGTPPPKGAKTQRLHDTRELEEIRQKIERAG